jgi:hypothetical protein
MSNSDHASEELTQAVRLASAIKPQSVELALAKNESSKIAKLGNSLFTIVDLIVDWFVSILNFCWREKAFCRPGHRQ